MKQEIFTLEQLATILENKSKTRCNFLLIDNKLISEPLHLANPFNMIISLQQQINYLISFQQAQVATVTILILHLFSLLMSGLLFLQKLLTCYTK